MPDAPACDLPFSEETLDPAAVLPEPPVPSVAPRFKITYNRIMKYQATPGCRACLELGNGSSKHTKACRERFAELLRLDGELGQGVATLEPDDAPPQGPVPSFLETGGPDEPTGVLHDTSKALGPFPDEPPSPVYSVTPPGTPDDAPTPPGSGAVAACSAVDAVIFQARQILQEEMSKELFDNTVKSVTASTKKRKKVRKA